MKVTICGSIAFIGVMQELAEVLERKGHQVKLPPSEIADGQGRPIPSAEFYRLRKADKGSSGWIWERKVEAMKNHLKKVGWADAILVVNPSKNGVMGYIGSNTFLEMGLAFHLGKKIFMVYPIPDMPYCREEIIAMDVTIVGRHLGNFPEK